MFDRRGSVAFGRVEFRGDLGEAAVTEMRDPEHSS